MSEEEWTEWFLHDGKGCPIPGKYAQWIYADGTLREGLANMNYCVGYCVMGRARGGSNRWVWHTVSSKYRIIRYRIRKPRALQQLREIAENVKEGVEA